VYKSSIRNNLWKKVGRRLLYLGTIFNTEKPSANKKEVQVVSVS